MARQELDGPRVLLGKKGREKMIPPDKVPPEKGSSDSDRARADDFARLGDLLREMGLPASPAGGPAGHPGAAAPTAGKPTAAGDVDADIQRRLAFGWAQMVGPEIAKNALPLQLRHGRLVVVTSSSAWAQTLQLMADKIAGRVNAVLGGEVVREVACRHAGWDEVSKPGE